MLISFHRDQFSWCCQPLNQWTRAVSAVIRVKRLNNEGSFSCIHLMLFSFLPSLTVECLRCTILLVFLRGKARQVEPVLSGRRAEKEKLLEPRRRRRSTALKTIQLVKQAKPLLPIPVQFRLDCLSTFLLLVLTVFFILTEANRARTKWCVFLSGSIFPRFSPFLFS